MMQHLTFFLVVWCLSAVSIKTGFGRGLLVLPVLISLVGPHQAVTMITAAQLTMVLPRLPFQARHIQWRPVGRFLSGDAAGCVIGAAMVSGLARAPVNRMIGIAFLGLVLYSRTRRGPDAGTPPRLSCRGGIAGALSGITGTSASLRTRAFAPLGMNAGELSASLASAAVALHSMKMLVYQRFIELDWRFWRLAAVVCAGMLFASLTLDTTVPGKQSPHLQRMVEIGLVLAAAYLLVHGTAP